MKGFVVKRKFSRWGVIAAGVALIVGGAMAAPAQASGVIGGAYRSIAHAYHPDWMSGLPDNTRLSELSVPGTHDTLSIKGTRWGQTQEDYGPHGKALERQLLSGIRAFDFRFKPRGSDLPVYHGIEKQKSTARDVITKLNEFYNKHKRETTLLRIKCEGDCGTDGKTFLQLMGQHIEESSTILWEPSFSGKGRAHTPTLGEVRGKAVLMVMQNEDGRSFPGYGLDQLGGWNDGSSTYVQDEFEVFSVFSIGSKVTHVKRYLERSRRDPKNFYVNFMSGASFLVFPSAVAGGVSRWFFRIEGVNSSVLQHVNERRAGHVGVLMMDFPGGGLIDAIVSMNKGPRSE